MSRKTQRHYQKPQNQQHQASANGRAARVLGDEGPYAVAALDGTVDSASRVVDALGALQRASDATGQGDEQNSTDTSGTEGLPLFRSDTMLESLRYENYDFVHGLGELVDNSVESGAHNIWVTHKRETVAVKKAYSKAYPVISELAVVDDGEGMTPAVLAKALVLGESVRPDRTGGRGIGRFGVGMTLGALSLARRIDVYSRPDETAPFFHTFIDLDLVKSGGQTRIPTPRPASAPAEYADLLKKSSGTIVALSKCDRLQTSQTDDTVTPADEHVAGLSNWLGRTYRKFIANGLKVWRDGEPVFLHDPMYLMGPTVWDAKGKNDPRAKALGTDYIELPVPGHPERTAKVAVTMSLTPIDFRRVALQGGKGIAKERRVNENEGVSILRANREVLYDKVPRLYSGYTERGMERGKQIDRFWSCEIAFPPELDPYFKVKYIKRGVEPVPFLRDKIRDMIDPVIKQLRKDIQEGWRQSEAEAAREQSAFAPAEDAMAAAEPVLPRQLRGAEVTREREEREIEEVLDRAVSVADATPEEKPARKAAEKKRLEDRPYNIVAVRYPANIFFTTKHLHRKIIIELNTNHVFYQQVFEPIFGSVQGMTEESDIDTGTITPEQRRARDAFMLLLLAYSRAEAMFRDDPLDGLRPSELFDTLRTQWGLALGAGIGKVAEVLP